MAKPKSPALLTLILLSTVLATPALAGDDHDQARDLYSRGDIQGLGAVLRRAGANTPGDVVGIDLVQQDGAWVYRLDILGSDGHRRTVEVNASGDGDDAQGSPAQ